MTWLLIIVLLALPVFFIWRSFKRLDEIARVNEAEEWQRRRAELEKLLEKKDEP